LHVSWKKREEKKTDETRLRKREDKRRERDVRE
jgi:hypothetical protein